MHNVHTIPADQPFLETLIEELLRWDRERLADTLLLLPSRRACLAAREVFLRVSGGVPLLLPRLVPIGEPDEPELLIDPALELTLAPAISPVRRQLLLTRLVQAKEPGMPLEQAVRLAAELARFLDELHNEEVGLAGLDTLVPADLADHWQKTQVFLQLLAQAWPPILAAEGCLDPSRRRCLVIEALSTRWKHAAPSHPVIAAGITGSLPTVARLLAQIARLPNGTVVLPALDQAIDDAGWDAVGPTHPQYGLKRLLDLMEVDRWAVRSWPDGESKQPHPRIELWNHVLRPAMTTEGWRRRTPLPVEATAGLEVAVAADLAGEALHIALRMRHALERSGKRAVLITPSRVLGRRVATELQRWGIKVDDSAGVPLDQSPPGTFLLLTAHLVAGEASPVTLLSALKHPLASGGIGQREFRRFARALERGLLRGPRLAGGLDGIIAALRAVEPGDRWEAPVPALDLLAWLEDLRLAAEPFARLLAAGPAPLPDLLKAHLAFAEWLAADGEDEVDALWSMEAGATAREFMAELQLAGDVAGPVPSSAYPALLAVLMGTQAVRPRQSNHPRLAILGLLEGRLVQADLVLIGGLNEGAAPPEVDSGPWLNRAMRRQLGLPPVEQAVGIAAHDFMSAASAPEVVLSRSTRDENGSPTTPSRWLARLGAALTALDGGHHVAAPSYWSDWAVALDAHAGRPRPQPRPEPRPPVAVRPRELWATEIERLMRDPYAVYARRILMLPPLEPIDAEAGGAERGQIIHAVLDEFVRQWPEGLPDDPLGELRTIGLRHFARQEHRPQVWALWWPRFERIAAWFSMVEQRRRREVARIHTEIRGALDLEAPGGPFLIRARADRIEIGTDGRASIVDYKTGTLPRNSEVTQGIAPQLTIEALIAEGGGFGQLPAAETAALLFLQLRGGDPSAGDVRSPVAGDLRPFLDEARAGLARLVAHFDNPATAYVPVPRPDIAPTYNDYAHLARIGEWWGTESPP